MNCDAAIVRRMKSNSLKIENSLVDRSILSDVQLDQLTILSLGPNAGDLSMIEKIIFGDSSVATEYEKQNHHASTNVIRQKTQSTASSPSSNSENIDSYLAELEAIFGPEASPFPEIVIAGTSPGALCLLRARQCMRRSRCNRFISRPGTKARQPALNRASTCSRHCSRKASSCR